MKTNLNQKLMLAAAVVIMLNFSSCKYEDGPKFTLQSKTARLVGEWEVVKMQGDKIDSDDGELFMEFDKDGDLEFKYVYDDEDYTYKGEWEWEDNKAGISINLEDEEEEEFEILKLTGKEMVLEDEDGEEWELEKVK